MRTAIVVGSGAGGATVAKELQGSYDVTVLEAGRPFRPVSLGLPTIERIRRTGLLLDERELALAFPALKIRKTTERMVLVNGIGVGGTTTICTGNALRLDHAVKALGIDLDAEFQEIYDEIPISSDHQRRWRRTTRRLFEVCQQMDLNPQPMPKMGEYDRCRSCGRCILGCPHGVKWDSRRFLQVALDNGAQLVTGCRVESIVTEGGQVTGVQAWKGLTRHFYPADLVVLAAGGFATPTILQNSGIDCEPRLHVDPVLCVAAEWPESLQCQEIPMPFFMQREHFILSPYFDYVSYLFNRAWNYRARDLFGIMIKLADSNSGSVSGGQIVKSLSGVDRQRLDAAVAICTEILERFGVPRDRIMLGTLNAGHPGGMLPLTRQEATTLHHARLPANLYVADGTLLPNSPGGPPILTIVALAKRVSRMCM